MATMLSVEKLSDMLCNAEPAQWVREMHEHFLKTGTYRAEDLRRVLGDRKEGIEIKPVGEARADLRQLLAG